MNFQFQMAMKKYLVSYHFELQEESKEDETNIVIKDYSEIGYKAVIKNEVLTYSYKNKNGKIKKSNLSVGDER